MTEPTMAELLRLDAVLTKEMPEIRFRRIYAAYAIKFDWPFCEDGFAPWLWGEEAAAAWRRWAEPKEEYSL